MEQWAEIRRMHFVEGLSIKAIAQAHRPGSEDDPQGDSASPEPPGLFAAAGRLEARPPS